MSEEIKYNKPKVALLHASPLWIGEVAARTAYNSFDKSEHTLIKAIGHNSIHEDALYSELKSKDIESSEILDQLAWVHHHHSVLELIDLTFSIKGTSRGVLQEHSRHRIQSLTVQSTRYTMSSVLNAFNASHHDTESLAWFVKKMEELDILVTNDSSYNYIEYKTIWAKLLMQSMKMKHNEFIEMTTAKSSLEFFNEIDGADELFKKLEEGKSKRNCGDNVKHIVSDNWKVDMIVKFNLRSMKNYLDLRTSGSAWIQMQWLANAIKEEIPTKYLRLIDKRTKDSSK